MKITFPLKVISEPLSLACGVAESHQTLPILANILIRMKDGKLSLLGNNVELEVSTTLSEESVQGENGEITVAAERLSDICQAIHDHDAVVELAIDDKMVTLHADHRRYRIQSLPADEFPAMENVDKWEERFTVQSGTLKRLLDVTSFAMATADARIYLNGLLIEFGETQNVLRTVATNGHRLARSECVIEGGGKKKRQLILPPKAVQEVRRLLDKIEDGEMTVEATENHVRFSYQDRVYVTKLIDARYPDYEAIMGEPRPISMVLDTRQIREAILEVLPVLKGSDYTESKPVRMILSKNQLRVHATNTQQEEAVLEIPLSYEGEDADICVNATYILDYLNAVNNEQVAFNLKDSSVSCILNTPGDEKTLYFVMPIRV